MRKLSVVILALAASCCALATAAHDGQRGTAALDTGGMKISVEYGSPELKGRDLETLIKPGTEWRMGADAATTLTTETPLAFGDAAIAKGKYILKAKFVAPQQWRLIFQTEDKQVVADPWLKFERTSSGVEHMKIVLDGTATGGKFTLLWGNLSLSVDFKKK